jgi:beta-phosphoglucomutase
MALRVVLFDFNGVIIDDEPIHAELIKEVIASENMRCSDEEAQRFVGRSDRACLQDYFSLKGRVLAPDALNKLLTRKTLSYRQRLQALDPLPLFPGVKELITAFASFDIKLGLVSGAQRSEIELVLAQANLAETFEIIVAAEDTTTSKPSPEGYLQAIAQFQQRYPDFNLQPNHVLAIEDSFAGLEAACSAKIPVVGVAHTYPFHMLQRRANWTVDTLGDLEVERLIQVYAGKTERDWQSEPVAAETSKRFVGSDPTLPHE